MKKVLVLMNLKDELREILESAVSGCEFTYAADEEVTNEMFREAEIILGAGGLVPAGLKECRKLEYIAIRSAGYDQYLAPGTLPEGVVMTNARGVYSKPVAEHALALTLSLEKNLQYYRDNQNKAYWHSEGNTSSIADSKVLEIGKYYARLAKALGAYVIGVKRTPGEKPYFVDELYTQNELTDVIGDADVIFNSMPGGKETHHLYNAELFAMMKNSALFINCGRGETVDTDALCDALESGRIRAAACDVFETEPLPADSRAWRIRNLVITPHRAGFLLLPGTDKVLVQLLAENLKAWMEGTTLKNMVPLERYGER